MYVSYNVNRHSLNVLENNRRIVLSSDNKDDIKEIIRKKYFSGLIGNIRFFLYRFFSRRFKIHVDLDQIYAQKSFEARLKSVLEKGFYVSSKPRNQTNNNIRLAHGDECLRFKDEAQAVIKEQLNGFGTVVNLPALCERLSPHIAPNLRSNVPGEYIMSKHNLTDNFNDLPTYLFDHVTDNPNSNLPVFLTCLVEYFENYNQFDNVTWNFEGCEVSPELIKNTFLHLLMNFVYNTRLVGTPYNNNERKEYYNSIITHLSGSYVTVLGSNESSNQLNDIVERILMPMTAHLNKGCGSRWNEEAIGIYRAQLLSTDHSSISMSDMVYSELTQLREHIFRTEMIPHLKYEMLGSFILAKSYMDRADYVDCLRKRTFCNMLSQKVIDSDIRKAIRALQYSEYMNLVGPDTGDLLWRIRTVDELFYEDDYDIHYQNAMISYISDEYGLKKTQNERYVNHTLLRHFVLDENKQYMNKRLQDVFFSEYYTPDAMANVLIHSPKFNLNDLFDELVPLENLANIEPIEVNDDDSNDQDRNELSPEKLQETYNFFAEQCRTFNKSSDDEIDLSKIEKWFSEKTQESDGEVLRYIMKKDIPLAGQYMKLINIRNGLQAQCYTDNVIMSEAEQARRQELAIRAAAKQKGEKWVAMKILKAVGVLIEHISISDA